MNDGSIHWLLIFSPPCAAAAFGPACPRKPCLASINSGLDPRSEGDGSVEQHIRSGTPAYNHPSTAPYHLVVICHPLSLCRSSEHPVWTRMGNVVHAMINLGRELACIIRLILRHVADKVASDVVAAWDECDGWPCPVRVFSEKRHAKPPPPRRTRPGAGKCARLPAIRAAAFLEEARGS